MEQWYKIQREKNKRERTHVMEESHELVLCLGMYGQKKVFCIRNTVWVVFFVKKNDDTLRTFFAETNILMLLINFSGFYKTLQNYNPTHFKLQTFTKYFIKTLVFMWNSAPRVKSNFYFFRRFLLVLTKFSFLGRGLGNNSMKFWNLLDIS